MAPRVDALYYYLLGSALAVVLLVAGLILYFSLKYRKGSRADRGPISPLYRAIVETTYIGAPLIVFASMFYWGATLFFEGVQSPDDAIDIHVIGKQWMWKLQQPSGRREINELHVPLGRAVRLTMISQDVIHSFYVPAFRVKQDVLPGRYVQTWFEPTSLGEFRLLCAEYCGTNHSRMIGRVIVMEPSRYEAWLGGASAREEPVTAGARLFEELRCAGCHQGSTPRGPALDHVWGEKVQLAGGGTVVADDDYLRESILRPAAKVVAGYPPIMPSFESQLDEEDLLELIAYLKSLSNQPRHQP